MAPSGPRLRVDSSAVSRVLVVVVVALYSRLPTLWTPAQYVEAVTLLGDDGSCVVALEAACAAQRSNVFECAQCAGSHQAALQRAGCDNDAIARWCSGIGPCHDVPPGGGHTCAQQRSWGKCDVAANPWMVGYCCATCFNCTAGCGRPTPPQGSFRFEAEAGSLVATKVASSIAGYSGTGYVTGFTDQDSTVTLTLSVHSMGLYEITIGYHVATGFGDKLFSLVVNSAPAETETFTPTGTAWGRVSAGKFQLPTGTSKVTVLDGWGYFEVDYIDITPTTATRPKTPPKALADRAATTTTRRLMSFLVDTFGNKVIAGTQVRKPSLDAVNYVAKVSGGKQPGLIEGGLLQYSPTFVERAGNVTDGYIEAMARWAGNGTGDSSGRGILALCWHWNSPADLKDTVQHPDPDHPWYQAFYTKNTNFDVEYALGNTDSLEYSRLIADLDAIAVQLAKTSDIDVPVLWRPLHEASGGWFWWGAKGAAPFKQLWKLMWNRFTQVHKLHNLIWVYTADPASHHDWYPGDDLVDIVGADVYEPAGSTMVGTWEAFRAKYDGKKLIALSETGGIIVPDAMRVEKTLWSWFNTWDVTQYNITAQEIHDVYNDPSVLTLDALPDWRAEVDRFID